MVAGIDDEKVAGICPGNLGRGPAGGGAGPSLTVLSPGAPNGTQSRLQPLCSRSPVLLGAVVATSFLCMY